MKQNIPAEPLSVLKLRKLKIGERYRYYCGHLDQDIQRCYEQPSARLRQYAQSLVILRDAAAHLERIKRITCVQRIGVRHGADKVKGKPDKKWKVNVIEYHAIGN